MIKKTIFIIFLLSSYGTSFSQIKVVYASHKYVMGDRDTKSDARRICFLEAKRMCLEKAGTYIESNTEILNFKLTKDQIRAYSAAVIQTEIVKDTILFVNGTMTVSMTVKAAVDLKKFNELAGNIKKDRSLEEKLLNQQAQINELKDKLKYDQRPAWREMKPNPTAAAPSRGSILLESAMIPGLGQVTQGRKLGWLYMAGIAAGGVYYSQQVGVHNENIDAYDKLANDYRSSVTASNRIAASAAYDKAKSSYEKCNLIIGAVAGLYAVNLLDALLFKPKNFDRYTGIQTRLRPGYSGPADGRLVMGLRLEVRL
jgi:hypothetical protein